MTIRERVTAANHGREALRRLEANTEATRQQLGRARDLLKTVTNHSDETTVFAALDQLEEARRPDHPPKVSVS